MRFSSLKFTNFRNYASASVTFETPNIVLAGANGQGKTNLLEALYLLSTGKSFRTNRLQHLVRWDADVARIAGTIVDDDSERHHQLDLAFAVDQGKRRLFVESKELSSTRNFAGHIDTFILVPQDIDLVEGAPTVRRDATDRCIFQIDPGYIDTYLRYTKALKQRNSLLRQQHLPPGEFFEPWEEMLAKEGLLLMSQRREYLKVVNKALKQLASDLPELSERYTVTYTPSWKIDSDPQESALGELAHRRRTDHERQSTTHGPHRDTISFTINGHSARSFASIGQRRSISLAWLLATLEVYRERRKRRPVLLLDDLELDANRCGLLMNYIGERYADLQTIVTTPDKTKFTFPEDKVQTFTITDQQVIPDTPSVAQPAEIPHEQT